MYPMRGTVMLDLCRNSTSEYGFLERTSLKCLCRPTLSKVLSYFVWVEVHLPHINPVTASWSDKPADIISVVTASLTFSLWSTVVNCLIRMPSAKRLYPLTFWPNYLTFRRLSNWALYRGGSFHPNTCLSGLLIWFTLACSYFTNHFAFRF